MQVGVLLGWTEMRNVALRHLSASAAVAGMSSKHAIEQS